MTRKILVVDDQEDIRSLIQIYLSQEGYRVIPASGGYEALSAARQEQPDLIILDVMLPDLDGFEICRQLSRESTMPVLLLSVKSEEFDKVLGLSLGADDYMTKPFSPRELVARVKAILRRTGESNSQAKLQSSHILRYQNMAIDLRGYQVTVNNEQVPLSGKEFELLAFLALHPNEVFSREQIYDRVWGADAAGDSRTVMVHIRRLRERLAPYPEVADCIKTVWGIGYKFQLDS